VVLPVPLILALVLSTGQLSGIVRSIDGTPVHGARVAAVSPASTVVETDAAGRFSLPDVSVPVVVEVSAPGFATVRVRVTEAPATIVIEPATLSESIVVTAAGGNVGRWRDPADGATRLLADDLDRLPAVTLDESLGVLSGFSLFRRSSSRYANPTTHGVTMRGLSASGASRGLVLFDGIPLNEGFGAWVTWTRLPAGAIARVEVERGLHGDVFGSDAVGGVIRVSSPAPDRTPRRGGSVSIEGGTQAVGAVDGTAGLQTDRVSLFGAGSWFRTDGSFLLEPDVRGDVDRRTDAEWASGLGRVAFVGDRQQLAVTGWGGRDDRGNGTVLQRNTMTGGTVAAAYSVVRGAQTLAARLSYSPNTFEQRFTAVADDRNSEFLVNSQRTETAVTRIIAEMGRSFTDSYVLVRGAVNRTDADFAQARPSGSSLDTVRDDSESLSVQASVAPSGRFGGRLSIGGGVRHEWRAAPGDADERDQATVGQVTLTYRAGDGLWLRGLAATSHRWPTLNELIRGFRVGDVSTLANPNLAPERSRSVEGAVVLDRRGMLLSAAAFHTRVNDAVANVTLPSLTGIVRERRNAGAVHSTGVEIDAELRREGSLRLRASMTALSSTFARSAEPGIEGNRVPQVPRVSASVSADLFLPRDVEATLVWRSASSQFDDDRNVFDLAPAHQVNARVAGRAGLFRWHLTVENLLDRRIEVGRTPVVTLAPGRSARVGVTWRR